MTALVLAVRQLSQKSHWFDPVAAIFLGTFLLLLLVAPSRALTSLQFVLDSLLWIAPFLVASIAFAAGARASGFDGRIASVFEGRSLTAAILLSAAFGALSPFCSCGVIPIIAGLLAAGVPLPPVIAFWLASPLMDPEMFILMLPAFPLEFIMAKVASAFLIGTFGGIAAMALSRNPSFRAPLRKRGAGCATTSCATARRLEIEWQFWRHPDRRALFLGEARSAGWFLLKWLSLAFLVESLMLAYLPAESVAALLGGDAWWSVPLGVLVGVPAYLNGYAAIPTVSALMEMGMTSGAALAFMLAGGVTSIPAAMSVFALVRWPVFAFYLLAGSLGALLAGLALTALAL